MSQHLDPLDVNEIIKSAHARGFAAGEAAMQERAAAVCRKRCDENKQHANAQHLESRARDLWTDCALEAGLLECYIRALPKTVGEG